MTFFETKTIKGCEAEGTKDSDYLSRTTLLKTRWGNLYLHRFHRSDGMDLHDHPFNFVSLILWNGYVEVTPCGKKCTGTGFPAWICPRCGNTGYVRRRKWPGMILFRRATHAHRIELINGRRAITLIWRSPYVREWGFFCPRWKHWRDYFREKGC